MSNIDERTTSEIFCWIGNLEISLENLQRAVTEFFAKDSENTRMAMLQLIIGQQQLWGDRPMDAIQKLIDEEE